MSGNMINEGRYTLVYKDGQYRTVRIKLWKKVKRLVLQLKSGKDWQPCAFIDENGKLQFWLVFKSNSPPERLQRIQKAMDRIMADPETAGLAYAMKENRCCRCGKELTVPASIHKGMGPECARRAVTRKLNKEAYDWQAQQGQPNPNTPTNGAVEGAIAVQTDLFTEDKSEKTIFNLP